MSLALLAEQNEAVEERWVTCWTFNLGNSSLGEMRHWGDNELAPGGNRLALKGK